MSTQVRGDTLIINQVLIRFEFLEPQSTTNILFLKIFPVKRIPLFLLFPPTRKGIHTRGKPWGIPK